MSERQLPWMAAPPAEGAKQFMVIDNDGQLVATCFGEDDGRSEAVAICIAINRMGDPICANCGEAATCFGSYETELTPAFACDECCAHGCEDGHCEPLADEEEE